MLEGAPEGEGVCLCRIVNHKKVFKTYVLH